jgi:hypothetical protein
VDSSDERNMGGRAARKKFHTTLQSTAVTVNNEVSSLGQLLLRQYSELIERTEIFVGTDYSNRVIASF